MKAFSELKKGDDLFIVRIESETMKVIQTVAKVCSVILRDESEGATVLYNDGGESAIVVDSKSSRHCTEFRPALREIWYFSDKYSEESFLKKRCEDLRAMIGKFEKTYSDLWKEPEEKTEDKDLFAVKGNILHIVPFKQPGVCDGNGNVYFHDGFPLSCKVFKNTNVREATEDEKKRFFDICEDKMMNAEPEDRKRLSKAMTSCGYVYNLIMRSFSKVNV